MKIKTINGFTLVELLIVISLIAILSVAVIATINPVEQANKARDAQYQNDATEILNAYERYYVNYSSYPWVNSCVSAIDSVVFTSIFEGFGVGYTPGNPHSGGCCWGNCTINNNSSGTGSTGPMIAVGELKSSILSKPAFDSYNANSSVRLLVYKESGDGGLMHLCYIPKSKINRQKSGLWCIGDTDCQALDCNFKKVGVGSCIAETDLNATSWTNPNSSSNINKAVYICLP